MDPNNLNTQSKINTSTNVQNLSIINRNVVNLKASNGINNKTNASKNLTVTNNPYTSNNGSLKINSNNNLTLNKENFSDIKQLTLRELLESSERKSERINEKGKLSPVNSSVGMATDRSTLTNYISYNSINNSSNSHSTPSGSFNGSISATKSSTTGLNCSAIPFVPQGNYLNRDLLESGQHIDLGLSGFDYVYERGLDSRDFEKDLSDDQTLREDSIENGFVGMTERRGGLSWIRTNNGNLLPQIENTWLKHIITSLQTNKVALMNFFNNLEKCLIESVQFLYKEGIKPYLGDVANQMKRSICDNFWSAAEVAYVSLHCKNAVRLQIELRVKGEMGWVVYLLHEPHNFRGFVDTHSTVNNYSDYYWRQLNTFASSILTNNHSLTSNDQSTQNSASVNGNKEKEDKDFNGGRYAFAERLKNEVEAFKDMRLGEVVHLVQLAIYSGIFVYAQRILLPVAACEKTAQELFPKVKKSRYPVCTSINEVLKIVSLLVDGRRNGLVLAQLKQQFMLQFNRELNPLSFGYRKLQNLLLSDLFNANYHLFVPVDSPHRTHIQNRKYPIPPGCKIFRQSKLHFDPNKFPNPITDFYDQYHTICPIHTPSGSSYDRPFDKIGKECTCLWRIEFATLPKVVQDSICDYLD
ncbi:hypothetical protein MACK_001803 [Theileria orientalis]|uniref:HTH OST-type domain-containing protein n=1 Tax=Theileria orientalis TaxID=68886 RepID=A0A976QWU7_THEOR|nr:hypothetical protein MACK_001803 [Theileria orientalis]